jgi:cobalt/nickel transport system permease protein
MHMPDGFIDAPVAIAAGVVAVGGIAYCIRGARRTLDERMAPMAGLTAAFIFAVQMLNFPVAAGTSGHLLGGALAAILVGPYAGALAVTTVLIVQALLFADGGLSALGLNIINMAFVTTVVGWTVFILLTKVLPKRRSSIVLASGIAAFLSVPAAALAFTLEYALGGTATFSVSQVLVAMTGVHALIGIGEGIITALTIGAVIATRPDLVYGARGLLPKLEIRTSVNDGAAAGMGA